MANYDKKNQMVYTIKGGIRDYRKIARGIRLYYKDNTYPTRNTIFFEVVNDIKAVYTR